MLPQPLIRFIIADDHPLFRDGLRRLLEAEPGFSVIAEVGDGQEALDETLRLRPDILLLDLSMPRLSGLDVLPRVTRDCPTVRTVLLTASIDRRQVVDALKDGARGVVLKETTSHTLCTCLRDVMAGGYWVGHGAVSDLVKALRDLEQGARRESAPVTRLTVRERQILSAVVDGATNEDIGRQCGLRRQTVKNHMTNIFDKLGVSSRLELAMMAISHGLVDNAGVGKDAFASNPATSHAGPEIHSNSAD